VCALALGVLAACSSDELLSVDTPTRIPAGNLESPVNAAILMNGATSDLECAIGAYIVAGGLIGEELDDATQTADRYPYDRRSLVSRDSRYSTNTCENLGVYSPLQTARVSANNLHRLLQGWTDVEVPERAVMLATTAAYEAYSMLLFGEGFCETAFSTFNADGSINYAAKITSQQAIDSAIVHFNEAVQLAQGAGASAQNILNLALVGRARAKLGRGDLAGARADAALVPAAFAYNATASNVAIRRRNRVWADNGVTGAAPISASSTLNTASSVGATYRNLNDPRVPVENANRVSSGTRVPIWIQRKYADATSPIRIASGDEAQLIVAEADIASNPANTQAIIAAFRTRGNEGPYIGGNNAAGLKAAVIEERRRALFLEGQHLGDLIRYNLPLTPAVGTTYAGGGTYGNQRCMPLPDVETLNNPTLGTGT
jgi:hypothetical protein